MKFGKNNLVPVWVFQVIALVFCLSCLIGIMQQFGMFPAKVATFTSEYSNSVTLSSNTVSFFICILLFIFWSFLSIKCFKYRCKLGGIGAILRTLSCTTSLYIGFLYNQLINSTKSYEDVMPIVELSKVLGYADLTFSIFGIILLVIKGNISMALKIGFAAYPIIRVIAVNALGGYAWYPWIEIIYAVGLLVWSFYEGNNTNKSKQL